MSDLIEVHFSLTRDSPSSMDFRDTYSGLEDIWDRIDVDANGNVNLQANEDGFEHLARYFLKMARSGKTRATTPTTTWNSVDATRVRS